MMEVMACAHWSATKALSAIATILNLPMVSSSSSSPAVWLTYPDAVNAAVLHPFLPLLGVAVGQRHFPLPGEDDSDEEEGGGGGGGCGGGGLRGGRGGARA